MKNAPALSLYIPEPQSRPGDHIRAERRFRSQTRARAWSSGLGDDPDRDPEAGPALAG